LNGDGLVYAMAGKDVWTKVRYVKMGDCRRPRLGSSGHTLEDLEVLQVGIFGVDVELDARHGHIH